MNILICKIMRKTFIFALILLSGCECKTETTAPLKSEVGVPSGGLIGGNAEGAIIGGAVGTAAGAYLGYALDPKERELMQEKSPDTLRKIDAKQPLDVEDIEQMSNNGLSDAVIINQIKLTHSHFHLSPKQIDGLQKSGVSQKVIHYMIETEEK